jgi:small subunit ribosomal protein S17
MSLLMGKCLGPAMRKTVRVLIPRLKFDTFLNMHFRENDELLANDMNEKCKAGDWVLVRQLDEPLSLKVSHRVEKIVYESGNIIEPLTQKQSLGYELAEDADRQSMLFGLKPTTSR